MQTVNPLREMRLQQGFTLDRLAYLLGTTRQFIIRAEQAVYADPPPRLLRLLIDYTDTQSLTGANLIPAPVGTLTDEQVVYHLYHKYQSFVRTRNYGALLTEWGFWIGDKHPFVQWRKWSGIQSRIGVSKLFCVHPALISKFENQPHLVQTPPGELMAALEESGYSKELLDSFAKAYDNYKSEVARRFKENQPNPQIDLKVLKEMKPYG